MRRRPLAVAAAVAAAPFLFLPAARAQTPDEVLSGYVATASGAIFSVQPIFPGLVPTGDAPFEITGGLTSANVKSGGVAFAQAQALWPGAAAATPGPLFGQASGQPIFYNLPPWQLGVQATQDDDAVSQGVTPGPVLRASGKDGRSQSLVQAGGGGFPGIFTFGSVSSSSRAGVQAGVLVSESTVVLHDVVLGASDVTMDAVKTNSRVTSNGSTSDSTGATEVTGLKIRGQGAAIDSEGLKGAKPLRDAFQQALDAAGIELMVFEGAGQTAGGSADHLSAGLIATIANPAAAASPQFVGSRFVVALAPTAVGAKASPAFDSGAFEGPLPGAFDSDSGGSFSTISGEVDDAFGGAGTATSGGGGRTGLPAVFEPIRRAFPEVAGVPGAMVLAVVAAIYYGSRWLTGFANRFMSTEG